VAITLIACVAIFTLDKTFESVQEYSAVFAEFLGTFALVFTVGCCVATGSGVWNATAIACVLMVMVYGTGPISGGHLNPAVTVTLALSEKFEWDKVPVYCATQVIAGIAAGSCTTTMYGQGSPSPLAPVGDFSWPHAFFVEAVYTFMLCLVVLNTAASKRNNEPGDGNQFFGLAIGFVIIAGGYAGGDISSACFNPAVAFGVDFSSIDSGMGWSFAWTAFELVGAALAALTFRLLRPEDYDTADLSSYVPPMHVKLVSEFLGAFLLVLTVGLNIINGSPSTAWSAAAALMCMIYALGDVSGAHFNPAVSLAVWLRGKCSTTELATYIPVQLLAGVAAGAIVSVFHPLSSTKSKPHYLQAGEGHTLIQAGIIEMVFTFVLCYVVLAVATLSKPDSQKTKQNFYFGLAIASCVTAGGFAAGSRIRWRVEPCSLNRTDCGRLPLLTAGSGHGGSVVGDPPCDRPLRVCRGRVGGTDAPHHTPPGARLGSQAIFDLRRGVHWNLCPRFHCGMQRARWRRQLVSDLHCVFLDGHDLCDRRSLRRPFEPSRDIRGLLCAE